MAYIRIRGFSSKYAGLNHPGKILSITPIDLARGIVTAGRSSWTSAFKGGTARLVEMYGVGLQTLAYVRTMRNGISVSKLFRELDRSEKAAASYRLGMGCAKLVAESELGIKWLRHLDPLVRNRTVVLHRGSQKRGDMVGRDWRGAWHVVEAKGRSHWAPPSLLAEAKAQAGRVVSVRGKAPETKCACITSLAPNPISIELVDPEGPEGEPEPLEIDFELHSFIRDYYGLITAMREAQFSFEEELFDVPESTSYMTTDLRLGELRFGLRSDLFEILEERSPDWDGFIEAFDETWWAQWSRRPANSRASLGLDGLVLSKAE